jgi:hypothetical protein
MNKKIVVLIYLLAFFVLFLILGNVLITPDLQNSWTATPWQSIGGCGAGGSGGGGGGIAKWTGKGVSGGLLNLQAMGSTTFGENYHYTTFNARFSMKPNWKTDIGLAIPVVSKIGNVQYRTNQPATTQVTGGLGDISLDGGYSFGSSSQYSINLSTTLPTGQYDIKRGTDLTSSFMPASLQKGSGLFGTSLGFSYTKDIDRGMIIADVSYSHPIALRLFSGENEFLDTYDFRRFNDNSDRFYYRFKPYGENDLGDFTPPSGTLGLTWAYTGHENRVQSIGFTFNAPFGVAWMHSEGAGSYAPKPDPDFKPWSVTFQYGYEFSNEVFPIYFAIQLPLSAQKNTINPDNEFDETPLRKWTAPDWSGFLQTGSIFLAFKSTFF